MEHRQGPGGIENVVEAAATGGGGQPSIGLVLQDGEIGSPTVQVVVMVDGRHDDEDGGEKPHGVTLSDHR